MEIVVLAAAALAAYFFYVTQRPGRKEGVTPLAGDGTFQARSSKPGDGLSSGVLFWTT